jgi:predicted small lipoprotein YifL
MRLHTIFLTALLALTMAGCGVRGGLERPSTVINDEGEQVEQPAPAPDRDFILDGLLL